MSDRVLKPGDLVLTQSDGKLSSLIQRMTPRRSRVRNPDGERVQVPVWATHSALVGRGGPLAEATLVHARLRVVEERLVERYTPGTDGVAVFRCRDLSDDDRRAIVEEARDWLGAPYGATKLPLHALDYLLGGRYVFRRLARLDDYPICSWHTAYAYRAAGYHFGLGSEGYRRATPHDFWRHVLFQAERWEQVLVPGEWGQMADMIGDGT